MMIWIPKSSEFYVIIPREGGKSERLLLETYTWNQPLGNHWILSLGGTLSKGCLLPFWAFLFPSRLSLVFFLSWCLGLTCYRLCVCAHMWVRKIDMYYHWKFTTELKHDIELCLRETKEFLFSKKEVDKWQPIHILLKWVKRKKKNIHVTMMNFHRRW